MASKMPSRVETPKVGTAPLKGANTPTLISLLAVAVHDVANKATKTNRYKIFDAFIFFSSFGNFDEKRFSPGQEIFTLGILYTLFIFYMVTTSLIFIEQL
jgi:hypothetical protein